MTNMLNIWIAESESWQSFIDFQLPSSKRAKYTFLPKVDYFYISIMNNALSLINGEITSAEERKECLELAKALEIFSLENKRDHFNGVNKKINMLFTAGLYYLSDYPASSWILSNLYPSDLYPEKIQIFLSCFLSRKLDNKNPYCRILNDFLKNGDIELIESLIETFEKEVENQFEKNIATYFSYSLGLSLIKKFSKNNLWYDVLIQRNSKSFWKPFVKKNLDKAFPIWTFFPSQREALNKGILISNTTTLQMPTSSGKSSLNELIIYNEFKNNPNAKILYLAPFRALASELKNSIAKSLGSLGIKSKTIYGGSFPTIDEKRSLSEINLLIATPEKFLVFENSMPDALKEFSLVICDEGHLLEDKQRGLSYELLLTRLKSRTQSSIRFIFISAIVPNLEIVNIWLGGRENSSIHSDYRPTHLDFAFLERMKTKKTGYYLDVNPTLKYPQRYQLYKYLFDEELTLVKPKRKKKKINSNGGLSVAVSLKAIKSGNVALFAPHKRGNIGVEFLVEEALAQLSYYEENPLTKFASTEFLNSLTAYFSKIFGEEYLLTKSAAQGLLFHHGDFPQGVREIIEDSLRLGHIRLVICTNTLAEGVNLPIKTMVLHSISRFNPALREKREPIQLRDLKNLIGRAGRAGKETRGLIIVPNKKDFERVKLLIKDNNFEPIRGALYNLIQELTQKIINQRILLSEETIEEADETFQKLIDSIDLSIVDLLSEEFEISDFEKLLTDLLTKTLSYAQLNAEEKGTMNSLFEIRGEKIKSLIQTGDFKYLKKSGATYRLFKDINEKVDFQNEIWQKQLDPLDSNWLSFILDTILFNLNQYKIELEEFLSNNGDLPLTNDDIKEAIKMWVEGNWYSEISAKINVEVFQSLRLINLFLSFNVHRIISTVIKIAETRIETTSLSNSILIWPSLLQFGISNELQVDLLNMGLIDREAVWALSNSIDSAGYRYSDYDSLREYLITNGDQLKLLINGDVPKISLEKIGSFIDTLQNRFLF
ncbi:DEAD/DEAH box helicase [Leptospira koniambonensis]|uniref:DEAD/DEAH box helicase n=1 Tax=Leptospira koniambonensis TaxID=2484950 RepID=A0A4R9JAB5_9LEPT|nr:DEAD/DEAH box helicase [Leptospira koniambonensis]TGL35926.1 DEAD/DEAH box helicase [Leptospira koniambonensis]